MTSYQESDAASRRDENQSALGCLIPLIATTVILAIGITLFSWLVLSDDEQEAAEQKAAQSEAAFEEPSAVRGVKEALDLESINGSVSSEALLEVVRSGKWQEFGQPEVFDLGSQSRVQRKFRRPDPQSQNPQSENQRDQDQQIRVTIHTFKSSAATYTAIEQTELPARAIQFDNKVVVVEPIAGDAAQTVEPLAQRLRRFRELLEEQEGSQ